MDKEKGEFFLSINFPVYCWLLKREMEGLPPLKEVDNFCVVTEELFQEYDSFKAVRPGNNIEVLLPLNDLIVLFMEKNAITLQTFDMFQHKFVIFPPYKVDGLCEWMMSCREDSSRLGID